MIKLSYDSSFQWKFPKFMPCCLDKFKLFVNVIWMIYDNWLNRIISKRWVYFLYVLVSLFHSGFLHDALITA